ncbi:MAG: glutamate synthase subunit beta, partial [Candidatus Omnitrophica bacterium]|nr:glutamate synthase subunit beta [Candidatus Omnitrophota bacterium]
QEARYRPVHVRLRDYREVALFRSDEASKEQACRCMDCGVPFCHWGCPLGNYIPEWNDLVFKGQWKKAFQFLDATNNFPEFTGRLCPAPCEYSCVLGINDDPVTIRENEVSIIEYGFDAGFIRSNPPLSRTGKKIAIIGSGPAGLAAAAQLNKAGHSVTVFERDNKIGGILRYGIPDFKLEKWVIDRRLAILEKEGVTFVTDINVGVDYKVSKLIKQFDAICLAGGARVPRDLTIEGRTLKGVYFAMDYLLQSNKRIAKEKMSADMRIDAQGKRVVVIGGGDTGADCVGTAHRQGANLVTQIEVMPQPLECRSKAHPWPAYPLLLKKTSSHQEGGERQWSILTKKFIGNPAGYLEKLSCVRVEFIREKNFSQDTSKACPVMREIPGSEFEIKTDMVVLAVGFICPEHGPLTEALGVDFDKRGNVKTDDAYMTKTKGVFAAGDMHRGQSLIVWAIAEGRRAAYNIDRYLMGESGLPVI